MAGLTQAEWYAELKAMVPSWYTQKEEKADAMLQAIAHIAYHLQVKVDAHVSNTFLAEAAGTVLNTHGAERTITRLSEELDQSYSVRVRNLFNQSNVPSLLAMVEDIIVAGKARIQEDFDSTPFSSRQYFCNRAAVFLDEPIHNTFSIILDKQVHPPFSYADREYFASREDFVGTSESLQRVFESIRQIVDDNKALGTFYRIIELLE